MAIGDTVNGAKKVPYRVNLGPPLSFSLLVLSGVIDGLNLLQNESFHYKLHHQNYFKINQHFSTQIGLNPGVQIEYV